MKEQIFKMEQIHRFRFPSWLWWKYQWHKRIKRENIIGFYDRKPIMLMTEDDMEIRLKRCSFLKRVWMLPRVLVNHYKILHQHEGVRLSLYLAVRLAIILLSHRQSRSKE